MARHIRSLVKRTGITSLFIASDKDPDVPDLQRRVGTKVGSVLQVYSGAPLLWTPWEPGRVSCIERCPHFQEPLYHGHLGDLVKCPVYSGAPLLWAPWGPGKVSCIERSPHFRGKFKNAYLGHIKVSLIQRCPYFSGVL